jgi:hypothetical protein
VDAQVYHLRQAAVPAADGLVGDTDDIPEKPEGCPGRHLERVEKLAVNRVKLTGFHAFKLRHVEIRHRVAVIWAALPVTGTIGGE